MATLKFVLSKSQHQKKNKDPKSMLMLRYTHKKRVTYFTTHKNIDETYWDAKRQCVKRSYPGSDRFNIYIKTVQQKVEDIVNGLMIERKDPNIYIVKQMYQQQKEQKEKVTCFTFFEYADKYINERSDRAPATIKSYKTTLNKLKEYQEYARTSLDWHSFTMEFYHDFKEFYTEVQGFTNNGFGKVIKILKSILNDASSNGYNMYNHYKHKNFKASKEDVDHIYLNENELQKLIDLDLSKQKKMDKIRDLFIVGCYTGLRFSDFSQLRPEHIVGNTIRIKTQKTDHWVTIPLFGPVKAIIEKYKDTSHVLPKSVTNQTMNRRLKELGQMGGINDNVLTVRKSGNKRIENVQSKYDLITTHSARRSFATNMFKRGIPSRVIMQITGHKTEKAFATYIKVSQEENAKLMLSYYNKSDKVSINAHVGT